MNRSQLKPDMRGILEHAPLATGTRSELLDSGLEHWHAAKDANDVVWCLLDQRGRSANTLSEDVLGELGRLLEMAREKSPRAVVFRSLKPGGFIVGADIREFRDEDDDADVRGRVERAQEIIERIVDFGRTTSPTIALVHGHCLGGGLELALACDYRIARNDAQLGFPEVRLGLHPGLGGTARLPGLIRPDQALRMMLTGKPVSAKRAKSYGLVDAVTEERHFDNAVARAAAGRLPVQRHRRRNRLMAMKPVRAFIARQSRKQTEKHARRDHYPAPYRLIDLWERHGGSEKSMLAAESRSFAKLVTGDTAQNLIRVYFLREALREPGKEHDAGISHVHVIGAGAMGGDIAAWCAYKGLDASLEDKEAERIGPAVKRATRLFAKKHRSARERREAADRLIPDPQGAGRARADLIIEAVPEKLELKQKIFSELETVAREDAILATNTSGILLEEIHSALERPERLAGLHFFNPVARMQLVELVQHDRLERRVADRLTAFTVDIGRLPVPVKSSPGFLVNRVLTPYLLEALALMDEGVEPEVIDQAALSFGMPMGPVELSDQVGLDIAVDVADGLHEKLDTPLPDIPAWLRRKVENEELGVKTGKGLYEYDDDGKPKKRDDTGTPSADLTDRLVLPMVNASVACLGEAVVADADSLDAAMIFGTGFAPFRGGPMHYAKERGPEDLRRRLRDFEQKHGERFAPNEHWQAVFGNS